MIKFILVLYCDTIFIFDNRRKIEGKKEGKKFFSLILIIIIENLYKFFKIYLNKYQYYNLYF